MPKIIGGSLHEHREQTRLKLFGALSRLMAERGFDAITLADIAQAAGVGRTAVYNHFADKESMLVGFIMHETEQYVAALEAELAGIEDPTDQLRAFVRAQCELRRDYHLAPGPDLRSVLSRGRHRVRGVRGAGPRHQRLPGERLPDQPLAARGGPRARAGRGVDRAVRAPRGGRRGARRPARRRARPGLTRSSFTHPPGVFPCGRASDRR